MSTLLAPRGNDLMWTAHFLPLFFTVPCGAGATSLRGDTWGAEGNEVPEPPDAPLPTLPSTQLGLLTSLRLHGTVALPLPGPFFLQLVDLPLPLSAPPPPPLGSGCTSRLDSGGNRFGLRFQCSFSNPAFPGTEFQPLALASPKVWGECPWRPQALCRPRHPPPPIWTLCGGLGSEADSPRGQHLTAGFSSKCLPSWTRSWPELGNTQCPAWAERPWGHGPVSDKGSYRGCLGGGSHRWHHRAPVLAQNS